MRECRRRRSRGVGRRRPRPFRPVGVVVVVMAVAVAAVVMVMVVVVVMVLFVRVGAGHRDGVGGERGQPGRCLGEAWNRGYLHLRWRAIVGGGRSCRRCRSHGGRIVAVSRPMPVCRVVCVCGGGGGAGCGGGRRGSELVVSLYLAGGGGQHVDVHGGGSRGGRRDGDGPGVRVECRGRVSSVGNGVGVRRRDIWRDRLADGSRPRLAIENTTSSTSSTSSMRRSRAGGGGGLVVVVMLAGLPGVGVDARVPGELV